MSDKTFELLHLLSIDKLTPKNLHLLLDKFGTPQNIISAPRSALTRLVSHQTADEITSYSLTDGLRYKERSIRSMDIRVSPYYSSAYPQWLRRIDGFPPVLFVRGSVLPDDELSVAVIGTRGATVYGKEIARNFATEFAGAGVTVISGMARGVDTAAHQGALQNKGRTIAVLGSGIDVCYPPENRQLMEDISRSGAVISEFNVGTPPFAHNFPRRNRVVSGLAKAVVAIEAKEKSGVMNTVKWALDQNKEVFAVPGNIYAKTSHGTNRLIKEGAIPVTSAHEVMDYLGLTHVRDEKATREILLDEVERNVWEALSSEPIYLDSLAERVNEPTSTLLSILLNLEMKGYVKQLPGMSFVKNLE
ncbi:MAG: DNA-processing protein DprA [candidate division WOR-3 bacterium]|nr:MAG: DNA-processing protein DprA [candidate division WOR-3 bacterium]